MLSKISVYTYQTVLPVALVICLLIYDISCHYCVDNILDWPEYLGDEQDCPQLGDNFVTVYNVLQVPWGEEGRAWFTIPPEVEIRNSSIPGVGLGAYAKTFIPMNTWLGEYEGEVLDSEAEEEISSYAWRIYHDNVITHYIDAGNPKTSNWVRWVNCARTRHEESVKGLYCMGKVFYITIKDVYPGQEMLVYYGHDYAEQLGIDSDNFKE